MLDMVDHGLSGLGVLAAHQRCCFAGPRCCRSWERGFVGPNGANVGDGVDAKPFEQRANNGSCSDQSRRQSGRRRSPAVQIGMSLGTDVHGKVLVSWPGVVWKEGVVACPDVGVLDFDHDGLARGSPVVHARGQPHHVCLCTLAAQAPSGAALFHAFFDAFQFDIDAGRHPFEEGSDAWSVTGAEQGHRQSLAKAHAHGAHVGLEALTFNRCLQSSDGSKAEK